jgi:heme-degrading monooxygenase HmoA
MVIVFRSRLRPDADMTALMAMGERMAELASAMPGFIDYKDFASEDGENLTLVHFDSEEHLKAWANEPEHRAGQERARQEFFCEYQIEVCKPVRAYRFTLQDGRRDMAVG